jgi:hypothetical protein
MRACAAAAWAALAFGAAAQGAAEAVGLERATRSPAELAQLRYEIVAEIWRQSRGLAHGTNCSHSGVSKAGCAIAGRPPWVYVLGSSTYADSGFRPVGAGVYVVAPRADGAALVRAFSGEILLAAGASVQLVDAAFPEIRIELRAPADKALPLGNLVIAPPGKVFGLLAARPDAVRATSAVAAGGRVALTGESGEWQAVAMSRPAAPAREPWVESAPPAAAPRIAEHIDVDAGAPALAYASGEGLGSGVVLYGATDAPVAEHVDIDQGRRALAYASDGEVGRDAAPVDSAPTAIAPAVLAIRGSIELPAREPERGANASLERLRAEVEAEIARDRARLLAASQQQACGTPASIRQGCSVIPARRFAFAG